MSINSNILYCGFDMFRQGQHDITVDSNKEDGSTIKTKTGIGTQGQSCDTVSMTTSLPVHITSVQEKNIKHCVITWSKIILKTDCGDVFTSGVSTDKQPLKTAEHMTSCGEDILLLGKDGNLFINRDSKNSCVQKLLTDDRLKDIKSMDGTEKSLHLVKGDGSLLCVNVKNNVINPLTVNFENLSLGVPVSQISCGNEHVLILDYDGSVYSYGGGSRGQLGHSTLEDKDAPTNIEELLGVKMIKVAAGGWHSICISDDGDVYVWGWNESGQLGLPCQNCKTNIPSSKGKEQTEKHCTHCSSDSFIAKNCKFCYDFKFDVSKSKNKHSAQSVFTKNEVKILHETDQSDGISPHQSDVCIGHMNQDHINVFKSKILKQDVEAVQVQSIPCVLDLVDDIIIKDVSCGSRHSAFVTEDGILFTCGWNKYGQLGHGDENTRPYLQTVDYLINKGYFVQSVHCRNWSTILTCRSNLEKEDKIS